MPGSVIPTNTNTKKSKNTNTNYKYWDKYKTGFHHITRQPSSRQHQPFYPAGSRSTTDKIISPTCQLSPRTSYIKISQLKPLFVLFGGLPDTYECLTDIQNATTVSLQLIPTQQLSDVGEYLPSKMSYFYRTQVYLGSDLWVQVSVCP